MATQAERSAAMRARLLEAGFRLFARDGYEATSTSALLASAGVSKGALYHHFSSKRDLFEAIFEQVSQNAIEAAIDRPGHIDGGLARLIAGTFAWLEAVRDPGVSRILLEEGPRVLGFSRARELESRSSLGLMIRSLGAAVRADEVSVPDIGTTARLLNAALAEAALLQLEAGESADRSRVEESLRRLIEGLGH